MATFISRPAIRFKKIDPLLDSFPSLRGIEPVVSHVNPSVEDTYLDSFLLF